MSPLMATSIIDIVKVPGTTYHHKTPRISYLKHLWTLWVTALNPDARDLPRVTYARFQMKLSMTVRMHMKLQATRNDTPAPRFSTILG